jgi:hypothetical protein
VLFLVALALPCPLCRRDVKDGSTCCNKCVTSLLGLVFVSHLVASGEGTLQDPYTCMSEVTTSHAIFYLKYALGYLRGV